MTTTKKPNRIDLDDQETTAMVTILAGIDAIFLPYRLNARSSSAAAAANEEARERFRSRGYEFTGGGSAAERKSAERLIADLVRMDLLSVLATAGRRTGVRLTDRGDAFIRSLTAGYRIDEREVWSKLKQLQKLIGAGRGYEADGEPGGPWIRETWLAGIDYEQPETSQRLVELENVLLSPAMRGWVESSSDSHGRLWYTLTDAGRTAIAAGKPKKPRRLPEYERTCGDFYDSRFKLELKAREHRSPLHKQRLAIPMPVGIGGDVEENDQDQQADES